MIKKTLILCLIITSCTNKIAKPPSIVSVPVKETYHGKEIIDHHRNLEKMDDSLVISWLRQQEEYSSNILNKISGRQKLIEKQKSYDNQKDFVLKLAKTTIDGKYFYTKIRKKEGVSKLYLKKSLNDPEILLFDPVSYSSNDNYFINYIQPDWKGNKIAISLTKKGEEVSKIIVLDVQTKKLLPDIIKNCFPGISGIQWLSDNSGFVCLTSPFINPTEKNYWTRTRSVFHKVGNSNTSLTDIFSMQHDPELNLRPEDFPVVKNYQNEDGYLFGIVGGSSSFFDVYFKKESDLFEKKVKWKKLFNQIDKVKKFVLDGNDLIFSSAKNSPKFRICRTSILNPDFENPEILVYEKKDRIITNFEITKHGLFFTTKKNGIEAKLYHLKDKVEEEIVLPKASGDIFIGSKGPSSKLLRVIAKGYLNPPINYFYDPISKSFEIENLTPATDYPDFDKLTVEEIEIPSHDGVLVPVSIIRSKKMVKNGENPALFFGYGSYGNVNKATFNPNFLTWAVEGGILVYAHVRGGGQKGVQWHLDGKKTKKPNTWKDMIAVTEYMIKKKYTSPKKSAIWGTSAGGILAARAMLERPDLYSATILWSPATNMLRSEVQPNGQNSIKEFGTVEIKKEFEALLEMDSYHQIKKGVKYPSTYVTAGMKDGRVVLWDPAKFVAKLQMYNETENPILFEVKFDQGHAGINTTKVDKYERYANAYAFALWQLGHPEYQLK